MVASIKLKFPPNSLRYVKFKALFKISHIRFDFAATAKISMASLIGNTREPCGIVSANKLYLANYLVLFTLG